MAAHVDTRVPHHSTPLGKAFLAFTPRERVEEMLDRRGVEQATSNTGSDRRNATTNPPSSGSDVTPSTTKNASRGAGVAAPILSDDDRILGAVSASGPSNRIGGERFREELSNTVFEVVNVTYA